MSDKASSTWHPRPCPPWQCKWCARTFGTDGVCAGHEAKCELRVEDE